MQMEKLCENLCWIHKQLCILWVCVWEKERETETQTDSFVSTGDKPAWLQFGINEQSINYYVFVFCRREKAHCVSSLTFLLRDGCLRNAFQETKIPTVDQKIWVYLVSTAVHQPNYVAVWVWCSLREKWYARWHTQTRLFTFSVSRGYVSVHLMWFNHAYLIPIRPLKSSAIKSRTQTHIHTEGESDVLETFN